MEILHVVITSLQSSEMRKNQQQQQQQQLANFGSGEQTSEKLLS